MRKKSTKFLSLLFTFLIASTMTTQNIQAFDFSKYIGSDKEVKSRNKTSDRYIIEVNPENRAKVESLIKEYQGDLKIKHEFSEVFNGFSVDLTPAALTKLAASGLVKKIHKTRLYYPLMQSAGNITHSTEARSKYNDGSGTVISIIDSGIDTTHNDLSKLPDESKAKIKDVQSSSESNFTMKVPKGHNFIDGNDIVKDTTKSMHGMHVAGIAGANKGSDSGINGIAPGAQLLAMKVFSNYEDANPESNIRKGAQDDDIIAAIEESVKDNADVINMSLGSDNGFNDPSEPMIAAINKAKEAGTLVVVAAGNSATAASMSSSGPAVTNDMHKTDIGLIGNPAVATGALSVASFENTNLLKDTAYLKKMPKDDLLSYDLAHGDLVTGEHEYVYADIGKEENYTDKDVKDKYVLIKRGEISFAEKATRAKEKGALGAIIFNNVDGTIGMAGLDPLGKFMVVGLTKEAGEKLVSSENKIINFTTDKRAVENPQNNKMSTFTSWGTTNELEFKPEITGVGGNIYSTVNDNKYETMSGTSMATPHVSGASAIIINEVRKNINLDGAKLVDYVRQSMMNTADVVIDQSHGNMPYSPRQQGAGLLNTVNAIENRVTITDSETNKAAGELKEFTTSKELKLVFTNYGNKETKYNFNKTKSTILTQAVNDSNEVYEKSVDGTISLSEDTITVPANSTKEVSVKINIPNEINNFVEGYIHFDSLDGNPNLHFSYMGFSGNWTDEEAIVPYDKKINSDTEFKLPPFLSLFKLPFTTMVLNIGENNQKVIDYEAMSFSPNGDNIADEIIPQPTIIRNLNSVSYDIVTKTDAKDDLVIHLSDENLVRRINFETYQAAADKSIINPAISAAWDGKVYNQQTGKTETAKDGKYYYRLNYKIRNSDEAKSIYIPFTIDTVKPIIKEVIQSDGKNYVENGTNRIFYFNIEEANKIMLLFAEFNKKTIPVEKAGDGEPGQYKITMPLTTNPEDNLEIGVLDYAYNDGSTEFKFKNESMNISLPKYIDTKINSNVDSKLIPTGKLPEGITKLEVKLNKIGTDETVSKTYSVQKNGVILSAFDGIVPASQGKYNTVFNLYNDKGEVVKSLDYGQIVYDYTAPTVEFTNALSQDKTPRPLSELIGDKEVEGYDIGKTKAYKVEVERSIPSGKVTIEGIVKDEVNKPNELIFTQGKNIKKVEVAEDGTFKFTYDSSTAFEFFNIKDPDITEDKNSANIEGLDLATPASTEKKTGKTNTYLLTYKDVKDNTDTAPDKEKPKTVIFDTPSGDLDVILGSDAKKDAEKKDTTFKLRKINGAWYYDVAGVTNFNDAEIYINNTKLTTEEAKNKGSGTSFSKLIKIEEGKNLISYKVFDKDGNLIQAAALKVFLDVTDPELSVEIPDMEILDSDKENIDKIIRTDADEITLKLTASDNGSGYILSVNGNLVKNIDDIHSWGNNQGTYEYTVNVPRNSANDNDSIISVHLSDQFGNTVTKRYIVVRRETSGKFDKDSYSFYKNLPSDIHAKTGFKDFEITEVAIDDKPLTKDQDYTIKDGTVVLNKSFIEKLETGEHIMKVKTKYETISAKLVVKDNSGINIGIKPTPATDKTREDLIKELYDLLGDKTDTIDIPRPPVVSDEQVVEEKPYYTTDDNISSNNVTSNNTDNKSNDGKSDSTKEKDDKKISDSKNDDSKKSSTLNKDSDKNKNNKDYGNKDDNNKNNEGNKSIPWIYIIPISLLILLLLLLLLFLRKKRNED